jgi:hypothetical protein
MTLLFVAACCLGLKAQVTSEPSPLQEDSQGVTIFFHADQGNKGLMGLNGSTKLYAHTGVLVNGGKDWKYAPTWGDNSTKYELVYVSENLWKLYIGDIRTYYGITNPAEKVTKLAFVFRNSDCSKEGKGVGNTDIFLDVHDSGLQIAMESSIQGGLITDLTSNATFKVSTTKAADIALFINDSQVASVSGQKLLETTYKFPATGNYTVKATAKAGDETVETTKEYCYASDSKEVAYPGGTPVMGPVKNADGSVTFCLGAPGKQNVIIVGEWNGYEVSNDYVMNYTDVNDLRYFWITVKGLENDRMYGYYFLIDGNLRVGDPYARLVLDPYNDKYLLTDVFPGLPAYPEDKVQNVPLAIYQGNINDYDWKVKDFKGVASSDLIIYELLFRDFTGTEGKAEGNGTVRAAIEKIPYLKTLGVNAIEVLPIMEFNGNISWGYNPNFYFAPDKAYGTPDDYKEFIDICHQNGIAVILDMVFNQSDGLHPWYQMYQPGENPFYNMNAPHAYSVLNDWNQGNPMVQEQWADVLRYWMIEYKFDGFRFDLVKGLGDNDSYKNNGDAATNKYNASRVARMKKLQEVMLAVNPNAYFINENLAGAQEENEMAATGQLNWANLNNAGCQFAMGYGADSNLNRFYAPKDSNRLWGSTVSYLESHDEQRLAYKQNQDGATGVRGNLGTSTDRLGSAAAQMILSPGAHMIWQFSELGNYDNTKNADGGNNTDPKTVRWNTLTGNTRRMGLYNCYSELIAIRNNNKELFSEEASFDINCGQANWQNGRTLVSRLGDRELYTVVNPNVTGDITVTVNFNKNEDASYQILSKSYNSNPSFSASAKTVTVAANCYVVIGSLNVSAVDGIEDDAASGLRAYAADGAIVVDYAPAGVEVYGIDGSYVGRIAGSGCVSVSSGIYILRSGSEILKLLVK